STRHPSSSPCRFPTANACCAFQASRTLPLPTGLAATTRMSATFSLSWRLTRTSSATCTRNSSCPMTSGAHSSRTAKAQSSDERRPTSSGGRSVIAFPSRAPSYRQLGVQPPSHLRRQAPAGRHHPVLLPLGTAERGAEIAGRSLLDGHGGLVHPANLQSRRCRPYCEDYR